MENPILNAERNIPIASHISGNEDRDDRYESKLYHSEFYKPKIVYDTFNKSFDLEKVSRTSSKSKYLQILFTPSKVFNSSFMMTFPEYETPGANEEDYNNILISNRNNEIPIYTNSYINYVRTGYNYDVKNKNQKNIMNWVGTGINAVGAVASAATGNTFGVAQFGQNMASSIVGNISGNIEAGRNIERKLAEAQAQATSVSNCDDIDLLQAYSGNKAKLMEYKVNNKSRGDLCDLFYYTGYKTDNMKIPNTDNRYWFNYVQAEPVFKSTSVYNEFLEDIKARYRKGVTIYHNHNNEYDLDQEKENWETWMVR